MVSLKQARRDAKQLFRLCVVDGVLDEGRVRRVVREVLQSRRRGYLTLLGSFQRLVRLEQVRQTAEVASAVPLPPDLQARVQAGLSAVYGLGINTFFAHNPALIGGMRIQIGSDVYDGSVRAELLALERSFGITSANGWHAES